MKLFYTKFYNALNPKYFLNNIWHNQIFRKYFFNTKNIFFNEFLLQNLYDIKSEQMFTKEQKNVDIGLKNIKYLNTDLWSNYVLLWRYEEQQRLLDNLFVNSRYFKKLNKLTEKKKKTVFPSFNQDLSLWYQLGYSIDFLKMSTSNFKINHYFKNIRSTILLEESLEYQHKLNIHLVGVLDNLSNLYEKDVFIQSKTFRGIFFRFFREILYPWFSCFVLTALSFFNILLELLYVITAFISIPLLGILLFYFVLSDSISNFDYETVWFQINFFDFLFQSTIIYNINNEFLSDYDYGLFFNKICWISIYLFCFFFLLFEGSGALGFITMEEENTPGFGYVEEGTLLEDIHDSCNLRVLELVLELSDYDFTNTDYNNYYIFSENSDEFRDIESGFSDLNQYALQLFGGAVVIFYTMQFVIQQDAIDDNELDDLYYYDGIPRHNQDYEDVPELDIGSFLSYTTETDSSFGLYEYPVDSNSVMTTYYGNDYNFFDEEGSNIEAYVSTPGFGFNYFSEDSLNYFFEYSLGISVFELFVLIMILFYTLLYFKLYYDWEVWVYREYAAREYFNRITFLGWQHSLSNEDAISDEDVINNITVVENNQINFAGNEQLLFSRDISPEITDIDYFFDDLEELIDFKQEVFTEEDTEYVDENELISLVDIIDNNKFDLFFNLEDANSNHTIYDKDFSVFNDIYGKFNENVFGYNNAFNQFDLMNVYKVIQNFFVSQKKNFDFLLFFKNILGFSSIFVYFYKNLSKIPNVTLRFYILKMIYFFLHFKKLILKNTNYKNRTLSNYELLVLKINLKEFSFSSIILEIEDEITELLITENIEESFLDEFNDFLMDFDIEIDLLDDLFFDNLESHAETQRYNLNFINKIIFIVKKSLITDVYNSFNTIIPLNLYSRYFQNNIIGDSNFLILDEENDLDLFFADFEDSIEYFNVDMMEVDLSDDTSQEDIEDIDINDENEYGEEEEPLSIDEEGNLEDVQILSEDETEDYLPDTVYEDDENPYDLFSYDFFFFEKFPKKKNYKSLNLIKPFSFYKNYFNSNNVYNYKHYLKEFNNFFLYTWSFFEINNNIQPQNFLYNVTSSLDLEFDTNYVEIDDDELYDDEFFLVPSQRILLHSLLNNFRYENFSWLDGWGTWSFLNYNKFEGILDTSFEYINFHVDEDADTDDEDMIELNLTFLSNDLQEFYNDNFMEDPSDFVDTIPDLSNLFDDLDEFEEDFVETIYLVEKPYIFIILFILFFECFTIFFFEYYFILFVFLEPENGDNFLSDLLDFRHNGIFFDVFKLKSYGIYLFILDFLTWENNIFNEVKAYQFIYYSIFCYIDEANGPVGTQALFYQQLGQQSYMIYWMEFYERHIVPIIDMLLKEPPQEEELSEDVPLSKQYYQAYKNEKKDMELRRLYYMYYVYYSIYETYDDTKNNILLNIEYIKYYFFLLRYSLYYVKLQYFTSLLSVLGFISNIPSYRDLKFYYLFWWHCEELSLLFPDFSFFFNLYFTYLSLFFWRFSILEWFNYIDYILYLLINLFLIEFFNNLQIYLLNWFDFTHPLKNEKILGFFIQHLKYNTTFQQSIEGVVKNITLVNKEIDFYITYLEKLILYFNFAQKILHIIEALIFENFIINARIQNYLYLFFSTIEYNIFNIFHFYQMPFLLLYFIIIKFCSLIFYFLQFYNYDLYFYYIIIIIYYIRILFKQCYITKDIITNQYTINRHYQFDDKFFYNRETILNYNPEILYDIETVTFINSTFDSYLYWI